MDFTLTTQYYWFWFYSCSCADGGSDGGFSSCGSIDGAIRTVPFVSNKSRAAGTSSDSFSCRVRAAAKCCCFVSKTWEDKVREASLFFCVIILNKGINFFVRWWLFTLYPAFHSVISIETLFCNSHFRSNICYVVGLIYRYQTNFGETH